MFKFYVWKEVVCEPSTLDVRPRDEPLDPTLPVLPPGVTPKRRWWLDDTVESALERGEIRRFPLTHCVVDFREKGEGREGRLNRRPFTSQSTHRLRNRQRDHTAPECNLLADTVPVVGVPDRSSSVMGR